MERTKLRNDLAAAITPLEASMNELRGLAELDVNGYGQAVTDEEILFAAQLCRTALDVIVGRVKALNQELGLSSTGGPRKASIAAARK